MTSIQRPTVRHSSIGTTPAAHVLAEEPGRPRYIRSPVYALRAAAGAVLMVVGFVVTVLFENALIGLFTDTTSMVESWPPPPPPGCRTCRW